MALIILAMGNDFVFKYHEPAGFCNVQTLSYVYWAVHHLDS